MENICVNNEDRLYFEPCKSDICDAVKEMLIPFLGIYLFALHIQFTEITTVLMPVHIQNATARVTHRRAIIWLLEY